MQYKEPRRKRIMSGSKEYICERICTTYIETGRTVRSLAKLYNCSKSSIGKYILNYAKDSVNYDLFDSCRRRAKQNKLEVYKFGQSENKNSDMHGSLD